MFLYYYIALYFNLVKLIQSSMKHHLGLLWWKKGMAISVWHFSYIKIKLLQSDKNITFMAVLRVHNASIVILQATKHDRTNVTGSITREWPFGKCPWNIAYLNIKEMWWQWRSKGRGKPIQRECEEGTGLHFYITYTGIGSFDTKQLSLLWVRSSWTVRHQYAESCEAKPYVYR